MGLHYNTDNSCFLVNGEQISKNDNKKVKFPSQSCLGSISNGFTANESREVSLNGNAYDFPIDYNHVDKSDMLNMHKHLMIKQVFIVLLSFSSSLATKCLILNDEPCIVRLILIDYNTVELKYYALMVSLDGAIQK